MYKAPNRHHQETNTQFCYRPDAFPVAQPTVSEHWNNFHNYSVHMQHLSRSQFLGQLG